MPDSTHSGKAHRKELMQTTLKACCEALGALDDLVPSATTYQLKTQTELGVCPLSKGQPRVPQM